MLSDFKGCFKDSIADIKNLVDVNDILELFPGSVEAPPASDRAADAEDSALEEDNEPKEEGQLKYLDYMLFELVFDSFHSRVSSAEISFGSLPSLPRETITEDAASEQVGQPSSNRRAEGLCSFGCTLPHRAARYRCAEMDREVVIDES